MKKIITLCLVGLLSACGGITQIDEKQQAITEAKLPKIHEDGGQLCVCRANRFMGSAGIPGLKANDEYIGDFPTGSFLCINLSPDEYTVTGNCTLCPRMGAETIIRQGQRKYMEVFVGLNGMALQSASRETGLSCIANVM